MAELIVLTGPAAERRLEIGSEERLVIGRDEGCNLVLDDSKVSRRHAYLQEIDGGVEVGDLGSSNGTFVNGRRIERPVTLAPGDSLRIGVSSMRIEPAADTGAGTEPVAAAPAGDDRSRIRRMVSGDSSVIQRLRLERSVRRATLLAVVAVLVAAGAVVAAVTGLFSSEPEPAPAAPSTSEIIAQVRPATVRIITRVDERSAGSGTGWVYDADRGLVVTNAHVVGDQGVRRPDVLPGHRSTATNVRRRSTPIRPATTWRCSRSPIPRTSSRCRSDRSPTSHRETRSP